MKKEKCEIIRDLMPLVIDHAASESSCELVDKHLLKCSECAAVFQQMGALPYTPADASKQDRHMLSSLRRKKRLRRLPLILILLIIGILLGGGGLYAWHSLTTDLNQVMPIQQYAMTLTTTEDGDGLLLTYADGKMVQNQLNASACVEDGKNVIYLWLTEAKIPQKANNQSTNCYHIASFFTVTGDQKSLRVWGTNSRTKAIPFLSLSGTTGFSMRFYDLITTNASVYLASNTAPVIDDDATPTDLALASATDVTVADSDLTSVVEYDEIRQGTPEQYVTLWAKGDALPRCSDELAAYFRTESTSTAEVTYDTMAESIDPATIPELQ